MIIRASVTDVISRTYVILYFVCDLGGTLFGVFSFDRYMFSKNKYIVSVSEKKLLFQSLCSLTAGAVGQRNK